MLALLLFIIITALVYPEIDPIVFFWVIMVLVLLTGLYSSFCQNGLFVISSKLPSRYTASLMNGQGFAGVAVSLSQIIATSLAPQEANPSPGNVKFSALIYFVVALVVLVVSLLIFFAIYKFPVFQYFENAHMKRIMREQFFREQSGGEESKSLMENHPLASPSYWTVFKQIWFLALSVFFVFVITLSLFPSIVASIQSVNTSSSNRIYHDLFVPFTFLLYNAGDFFGRILGEKIDIIRPKRLWIFVFLRTIFFPLFLLSNVILFDSAGNPVDLYLPKVFAYDELFWVLMLLFGLSNGFLANRAMILGPDQVNDKEKEKAGAIMVFFLMSGLFFGSLCSFLMRYLLCRCNPFIS